MKLPFLKSKTRVPEKIFEAPAIGAKDIIAPSSILISSDYLKLGKRLAKSFFIFSYPRYLSTAWFSPIINMDTPMDIGFHIYPTETGQMLKRLMKKVAEVQAEIMERQEKGLIRDPALETAYQDLEGLRDRLQTAQEKMFKFGLYLTAYANTEKELKEIETTLRSVLESRLIYIKPALYQQREGFNSSSPYGLDQLMVHTSLNTEPISSTFPFVSFDLSSNEGILYGINRHNNSLILFDRFSLENANSVVFAKAGSGKSYAVKLEILRSLMLGVDVIILDPENEYQALSEAVGGSFFNMSLASPSHINPFDLPTPREDEKPEDVLRSNIINLVGLLRIMLGGLTPEEDAIIDRALTETYAAKDITPDTDSNTWQEKIPLMSDFEMVLEGMEGGESLVRRVRKFTKGTFSQFFNQPTNVSMDNAFISFGIRDMEDELRPIAMFIIMRFIWNKVRSELKKRILVIDEAWWLMRTEDGASFLFGICKRARKYWLGVTTITQDVNDFMKSNYGQPIITNSSIQLLMKQSPATIDVLKKTFNLTEEEKYLLLEAEVGEGIFFAGQKHVAIAVKASYTEDQFITTAPEEVAKIKMARGETAL
ncbi:MAG: conjugal transfer protein TraC [Candidatus Nealsonbacteria bacterium RBG_13_42_11]|uniref:Conjugal transfer protein TraC n=1 Tax=Candidatus Nealsonbacteria bacterium RBG_13_42_11 TaxID=1801663 RepID=A0A1G2E144_9BACT|nr:MAG: conjugal transfer protein TraC [Candidatus Nealsonbacteria bacterium RBG_13_42_11]